MEISLAPVIVMVIVPFSWARAGIAKIKASKMVTTILVITTFIYPSEFDEPLLTVLGQSFSDKAIKVKCYNPSPILVKTLPRSITIPISAMSIEY
jgi:hypothetical protein